MSDVVLNSPVAEIVAAMSMLVPLGIGVALARLIRNRTHLASRTRALIATMLTLAAAAAVSLLISRSESVGAWDLVQTTLLFSGGLFWGTLESSRRDVGMGIALLVSLLLGEALTRLFLPPAPLPELLVARVLFSRQSRHATCATIFQDPESLRPELTPTNGPARPQLVMHVGDSMTVGFNVRPNERFVSLLDDTDPVAHHVTIANPGMSVDAYLAAARNAARVLKPSAVVVHLFTGNDVQGIDLPLACFGEDTALVYDGGEARVRFEEPHWRFTWQTAVGTSPAPYAWRVAAAHSALAAHLVSGLWHLSLRIAARPEVHDADEASWEHTAMALKAFRRWADENGIKLVATVMPLRQTLEQVMGVPITSVARWPGAEAGRSAQRRLAELSRSAGIDTLDAWDVVFDACQQKPIAFWFTEAVPGDLHFSPAGHTLFTDWLRPQLNARGIGGVPSP